MTFPGSARNSINLTPCLVRQIQEYAREDIVDDFFKISQKPAEELTEIERIFLLRNFFLCQKEKMIQPYPEYLRLLYKRGVRPGIDLKEKAREFSSQELLDLQVWFNLAWSGFKAEEEFPELRELKEKGRNFTEQLEILKLLLEVYIKKQISGNLEISTTPFYHPLLPLICDTEIARQASPNLNLPPRFAYPEDARAQIQKALDYMSKIFPEAPQGIWPSEAGVSDAVLEILAGEKVKWALRPAQFYLRRPCPGAGSGGFYPQAGRSKKGMRESGQRKSPGGSCPGWRKPLEGIFFADFSLSC